MPDRTTLGILFCDISNSSRLYRELGDRHASSLVRDLLEQLSATLEDLPGRVVDRIGDELMCCFESAPATARAAVALQRETQRFGHAGPDAEGMAVRIGMHFGEVLQEQGRLFGDTVNLAKRIADSAKAEQILLARALREPLQEEWPVRFVDKITFKGQSSPTRLYELLWNEPDATMTLRPKCESAEELPLHLHVMTPSGPVRVGRGQSISIGRSDRCEVQVITPASSRLHAVIEERKGRFVLRDVSTNGSFVGDDPAGTPNFVHRDEITLKRRGLIGIGEKPDPTAPHTLPFRQE